MKKLLVSTLALGMLVTVSQASAATVSVPIIADGFFFNAPGMFTGWTDGGVQFRNHPAFDAQGYFKFDVGGSLAGLTAADITSATLSWSTYHMKHDTPNMQWRSPENGYKVDLFAMPYASAVNMDVAGEPGLVPGAYAWRLDYAVVDDINAADGTYMETITMDLTNIVKGWVGGTYANHGIKMDILNNPVDNGYKYYMYAFAMEDNQHLATLNVETTGTAPVPVPAAVWLLGSGLAGLAGLRRRKG